MRMLWAVPMLLAMVGSPTAAQMKDRDVVEVPLRVQGGRLVVPVLAADGGQFEFYLSTGNTVTIFSESTAARLGTPAGLTMGGLPIPTEDTRTIPDADLTSDGKALDGIIASNMLNQFDILIDVPGQRLVLKDIGPTVEWEGMTLSAPVRVQVMHGMLMALNVELDGIEYFAMIDVGASSLVVNERVMTDMGFDGEGVGTLTVGGATIPDVPVRFVDLEVFNRWSPNGDGFVMVGSPLAQDCAISLSWVHREIRTCVR